MKFLPLMPLPMLFITLLSTSCMKKQNFSGEYYLQGVPEMASGFRFMDDGKFEFYYIYGAVDRNATGTFTVDGDTIKLKSDKEAGNDFNITAQRKAGSGYTIQIKDPNSILASNVMCYYFVNGEQNQAFAGNDGVIYIEDASCEKIYVQHLLYPDVATLIKDENNSNNYFELTLKPILGQVSFKGIDLALKGDVLTCLPNYLMPMDNIRFVKSKS